MNRVLFRDRRSLGKPSRPRGPLSRIIAIGVASWLLALLVLLAVRWEALQTWRFERASLADLQAQAQSPRANPWVHYYLGRALARRQRHAEAAESFRKGLDLQARSDNPKLRARLDGALAESLVLLGADREAVPHLKRALEFDVGDIAAHMAMGRILVTREQYDQAVREFQTVTQLEPRHAEAWFALGQTYNAMKKPELAEPPLRRAVELAPDEARYHRGLGDAFARRSRFNEAVACFQRALTIDPQNREIAGLLARARALQARTPEEYREARKALLELDAAETDNAFFQGQVGILDAQHGNLAEAEKRLKRALALDPHYAEALYNLATVYRQQGRHKEAQETLARFQRQENLLRRVSALQKRLSRQPNNAALSRELARAFEAQGKYAEAAAQLRRHLRIAPDDREAQALWRRLERTQKLSREGQSRP